MSQYENALSLHLQEHLIVLAHQQTFLPSSLSLDPFSLMLALSLICWPTFIYILKVILLENLLNCFCKAVSVSTCVFFVCLGV